MIFIQRFLNMHSACVIYIFHHIYYLLKLISIWVLKKSLNFHINWFFFFHNPIILLIKIFSSRLIFWKIISEAPIVYDSNKIMLFAHFYSGLRFWSLQNSSHFTMHFSWVCWCLPWYVSFRPLQSTKNFATKIPNYSFPLLPSGRSSSCTVSIAFETICIA